MTRSDEEAASTRNFAAPPLLLQNRSNLFSISPKTRHFFNHAVLP
jgi:hypothetical protein